MSEENTGTSLEQAMIDNVQEQAAEVVEATEEAQQPQEELSAEEKEAAEKEAATKAAEAALGGVSDEAEGEDAGEASASAAADAAAAADAEYKSRLRAFTKELKKQPGQWYIIQ